MRGIVTDEYKFARYFLPTDHHSHQTMEQSRIRIDDGCDLVGPIAGISLLLEGA